MRRMGMGQNHASTGGVDLAGGGGDGGRAGQAVWVDTGKQSTAGLEEEGDRPSLAEVLFWGGCTACRNDNGVMESEMLRQVKPVRNGR